MSARLFMLLATAAFALGCPRNNGGDDGGAGDGAGDGGADGSGGDGGGTDGGDDGASDAAVGPCTSNAGCAEGKYCDDGECIAGKPCPAGQFDCEDQPSDGGIDYCIVGGCFCDPVDHACKPRYKLCAACTDSLQCGNDDLYYLDYLADCAAPSGGEGNTYCLQRTGGGSCQPGYQDKNHGYCEPPTGSCVAGGNCVNEGDCDPLSATPVCNFNNNICVPGCVFDVRTGESSCAPGQVCNIDPRLLDSTNPNFARGRCGAPCVPGTTVCPAGTVCASDGPDTNPVNRCRLEPPACIDDYECPDPDGSTGPYRGYCDLASKSCKSDCRVNDDCNSGFKCADHACVEMDCVERGGAVLKCAIGEFCCGEAGAPSPCPSGVQVGHCYPAPDPPWCQACENDSSCADASYDPAKPEGNFHKCIEGVCYNGCDPAVPQMCPRSWQCKPFLVGCQQASDCNQANCEPSDPNNPDSAKLCNCPNNEACPTDTTCDTTSTTHRCIWGRICSTTQCAQ